VETIEFAGRAGQGIESETEFAALLEGIERSAAVEPRLVALEVVRNGVITGEGPTTAGRVHFSRAIDSADTAWLRRILLAGGQQPVMREEADALFEIHHAAFEQVDGGAFDDLAVKAIAHHALAASGHRVPARATALASATAIGDWASGRLDPDVAAWLESRLRRSGRRQASLAALAALLGTAAALRVPTLAVDLAA
jgi:hypothetical protein